MTTTPLSLRLAASLSAARRDKRPLNAQIAAMARRQDAIRTEIRSALRANGVSPENAGAYLAAGRLGNVTLPRR